MPRTGAVKAGEALFAAVPVAESPLVGALRLLSGRSVLPEAVAAVLSPAETAVIDRTGACAVARVNYSDESVR